MTPQPPKDRAVTMHCYYMCLKRDATYEKRVSWLDGLPKQLSKRNIAVLEYILRTVRHRHNAKVNTQAYNKLIRKCYVQLKKKKNTKSPVT